MSEEAPADGAANGGATADDEGVVATPDRGDDLAGNVENSDATAASTDDEFGWRGWVLVGVVVVSFLVIPWTIILLRRAQGVLSSLGLGLRDAYLVLPLVPAIGLAAVAVWSAVASRRKRAREK